MPRRKITAPFGASLVVLSSLFYASYGIWTTLMGNFFGGYMASALRSIIALAILFPIALVCRQLQPIKWKRDWRYLAGLLLAVSLVWGPLYYSILHAGVGVSLAINYACIVIGMFFFGWLFNNERFTKDKLLSALLGLGGLTLVFLPSLSYIGWLALAAAVVSGFSCAAYMIFAKKMMYNTTQSTLLLWVASTIASAGMAIALHEAIPSIGWHMEWAYLVIFAGASIAASWTFIRGVKVIDAGAAGILGLLEIVFGILFGVIFFNERPGAGVLLGVLVIIVSAAIPYAKDYHSAKET